MLMLFLHQIQFAKDFPPHSTSPFEEAVVVVAAVVDDIWVSMNGDNSVENNTD